jgi:hypothetical protein
MTGSVFLQDRLPFDIMEDSLTNKGHKHCDRYHLTGGFSYSLSPAVALGLKADYTAANYAKYKDLRHKNKLMNLDVTIGLLSTLNCQLIPRLVRTIFLTRVFAVGMTLLSRFRNMQ